MAKSPEAKDSLAEAKKLLDKEVKERVESCSKEIQAVCEKYNCAIDVAMLVGQQGNKAIFNVVPLKEK